MTLSRAPEQPRGQGDGVAVEVDLFFGFFEQLQALQYRQGLRGEGFVEFDVVDGQAGAGLTAREADYCSAQRCRVTSCLA